MVAGPNVGRSDASLQDAQPVDSRTRTGHVSLEATASNPHHNSIVYRDVCGEGLFVVTGAEPWDREHEAGAAGAPPVARAPPTACYPVVAASRWGQSVQYM